MIRKKKNSIPILILLLLGISLGYALLSQDLTINGTSKVKGNTWDIHFNNVQINSNSVTLSTGDSAATINQSDNTLVEYTVTLNTPGDFYEFTVDAVNAGTVDGMIGSVVSKLNGTVISTTNALPSYLDYQVTYEDGVEIAPNHLLEANSTETFKVRIEFKRDIENSQLPSSLQTNTFSFGIQYVQADANSIPKPKLPANWILPVGRTANNLIDGDEICLEGTTTECFNFIRYDGNNAVLLAKYNIKVGLNEWGYGTSTLFVPTDSGYGLQSSEMTGVCMDTHINYAGTGAVAFSATNYWDDNGSPKSKYFGEYYSYNWNSNSDFPIVYDTDYTTDPVSNTSCNNSEDCFETEGYSIAYYVEQYKDIISGVGYNADIKEARLLKVEDLTRSAIGCSITQYGYATCPNSYDANYHDNTYLLNTSFWLGSAYSSREIWFITCHGRSYNEDYSSFDKFYYDDKHYLGVRPVIVISTSDF